MRKQRRVFLQGASDDFNKCLWSALYLEPTTSADEVPRRLDAILAELSAEESAATLSLAIDYIEARQRRGWFDPERSPETSTSPANVVSPEESRERTIRQEGVAEMLDITVAKGVGDAQQ